MSFFVFIKMRIKNYHGVKNMDATPDILEKKVIEDIKNEWNVRENNFFFLIFEIIRIFK